MTARTRRLLVPAVLLPLALLVAPGGAGAQPAGEGADLRIYLVTMDPGARIWERFGHNALWVHDPVAGTNRAYNYGLFDFDQPGFVRRFVQGRMLYWMQGIDMHRTIEGYAADGRTVSVQELNLPPDRRARLRDFLVWNELPENRYYRYDYFYDNCSTRIRDALDLVLDGRLREQTAGIRPGTTLRYHARRLTRPDPLASLGIHFALGPAADRPISAWDEMFIPMQMRALVRDVTIPGPAGREVPLVAEEYVVYEGWRDPGPQEPPDWTWIFLLGGILLGAGMAAAGAVASTRRPARLLLLVLAAGWSLLAGIAGVGLAVFWAGTDHVATHANLNLLHASPVSLVLSALLFPFLLRDRFPRALPALAGAVASLSLLAVAVQLLGGVDQANSEFAALFMPAHIGLLAGVLLVREDGP